LEAPTRSRPALPDPSLHYSSVTSDRVGRRILPARADCPFLLCGNPRAEEPALIGGVLFRHTFGRFHWCNVKKARRYPGQFHPRRSFENGERPRHRRLYFAGNRLLRSVDRGESWRAVSPDLSRQRGPGSARRGAGGCRGSMDPGTRSPVAIGVTEAESGLE
jgi:hypothetical protein